MSMEHKAFVFNYNEFQAKLEGVLRNALETNDVTPIRDFIIQNLDSLKDPYEGEALDEDWEAMIDPKDVHQYGDFALTLFYDPTDDVGLGYNWEEIDEFLKKNLSKGKSLVLGESLRVKDKYFDPGKLGSYFQSPATVKENLDLIKTLPLQENSILKQAINFFDQAESKGKGLYITF